jgi:HEAT repeat protein
VVWALGRLRVKEAVPFMLEKTSPAPKAEVKLRDGAFLALREYDAADVLPEILKFLEKKDPSERAIAAEALRAIRSPDSRSTLRKLLEDGSDVVQGHAARALGELGDRESIPRLVVILEDESSDARGDAAYALSLLGAKEALPALRRGVQDPDRDTEGEFVRALGRFGDDVSRDFVVAGLSQYRDEGIYAAAMWLCPEGRKVAIQPLLDDAEFYLPLNAFRRPEEWKKLQAARIEGPLEGTYQELAERIGAAAGLAVDWEWEDWDPDVDTLMESHEIPNPLGRMSAAEALFEFIRFLDADYDAIFEEGRIRIVPYDDAEAFWDRWGAAALREK